MESGYKMIQVLLVFKKLFVNVSKTLGCGSIYTNTLGAKLRLQTFHAQLAPNLTSLICTFKSHMGSYCRSISSASCLQHQQ